jgi:hypothetical protein
MALYNHLPVYKTSYDLLVELFRFVKDFSRDYKFTLGESMNRNDSNLCFCVQAAPDYATVSPICGRALQR